MVVGDYKTNEVNKMEKIKKSITELSELYKGKQIEIKTQNRTLTPTVKGIFDTEHKGLRIRLAWDINGEVKTKNYPVCNKCLKNGKPMAMKVIKGVNGLFASCMNVDCDNKFGLGKKE